MKDLSKIQTRYMRAPLPVRLGRLAVYDRDTRFNPFLVTE
jgi:hypothetical protein